jgi:UDP-glucose 4-epimerase
MDIRDCIQVLEKLIDKEIDIINIGTNKEIDMFTLAEKVKEITKSKSNIIIKNKRNNEIKYRIPDIEKLDSFYKSSYNIDDTIKYCIKMKGK